MVVDPLGEALASAAGGETLVLADVDPERVAAVRARFPFLADRRPPAHVASSREATAGVG
jgi:predicted amidohydrolase